MKVFDDIVKVKIFDIQNPVINNTFIRNVIQPVHGTTTLAFVFKEGMIIAVDSRATAGSYIASQTVNKVIEINKYLLGTMAGCAADCLYWEKKMGFYAKEYEIKTGKKITASQASYYLSNCINKYKGYGMSMGTMVCGYDKEPKIYMVDDQGRRIENNIFSVGSGSTIAYGVLSSRYSYDLTKEEAIQLGKDAIYSAGHRDAYSGGTVNVYFMDHNGWSKIGRWDFNQIQDEIK